MKSYRVLKVQTAGDYREAYQRLAGGGAETYYAQRYSVECDGKLASRVKQLGVLCCRTPETYDQVLPNGVRAMGAGLKVMNSGSDVLPLMEQFDPTHLIVTTTELPWLEWGLRRKVKVLPILANSFSPSFSSVSLPRRIAKRWRFRRHCRRLAHLLKDSHIPWVSNHNLPSSLDLHALGVPAEKIVPWDWPAVVTPADYADKKHPGVNRPWNILFVGVITEAKGAGDVLRAAARLHASGRKVHLRLIGSGQEAAFRASRPHGLSPEIFADFAGRVPHTQVVQELRAADVAVVPSRHDFPEGLPMTIYESLAVKTPLVCSDHPMFMRRLKDGDAALVFPERDDAALARCIMRLMDEPTLYETISAQQAVAWKRLQIEAKYGDVIEHWLQDADADRTWLRAHRLEVHGAANGRGARV